MSAQFRQQVVMACVVAVWPCGQASADDDVEKAFKAQAAKPASSLSTSQSVSEAAQQRQQAVVQRATDRERQRAEDLRNASERNASGRDTSAERPAPQGSNEARYTCNYVCSNMALLTYREKARQSVSVNAPGEKAAIAKAVQVANDMCIRTTRKILESGTVNCRKE